MGKWIAGLAGLILFIAGCPPATDMAPHTRREALLRVNNNLARIEQPLQAKALVSFSFRDNNGQDRRFLGHEAALVYRPPQNLRFDIRSLAGVVAQFGSNTERYWVWIDPEVHKLWYGDWRRASEPAQRKLPIPPAELLDALLLRPLPESLEGGLLPLLRQDETGPELLFVRLGIDRQPSGSREVRLQTREPYQPAEIIDRLPDGQIAMHAKLENYQRVGSDGPYTPRRYVVTWPLNNAEMRLDILRMVFRPDLPDDVFAFPAWEGETEAIDRPAVSTPVPGVEAPTGP